MADDIFTIRALTPRVTPREVTKTEHPSERLGADGFINEVWQHWKIAQSEFHYRPAGEVDLGEISGDPVFPLESEK